MVAIGLRYELNINKQIQCNLINGWVHEDKIVNHSKDPKDLVQAGDLVNGLEVQEFDYEDGTMLGIPIYTPDGLFNTLECYVPLGEINIIEILTKEMYEQNVIKVVE